MDINKTKYIKPSDEKIKEKLSDEEFEVTQNSATEKPFTGKYLNNDERGLYVDVVTNQPLFTSIDKFDSGCGWPSFSKPVSSDVVKNTLDESLKMSRVEVRSDIGDSHLGHVFNDGPDDLGGLRYCINSAALKFIPYEDLDSEGYSEFKKIFDNKK